MDHVTMLPKSPSRPTPKAIPPSPITRLFCHSHLLPTCYGTRQSSFNSFPLLLQRARSFTILIHRVLRSAAFTLSPFRPTLLSSSIFSHHHKPVLASSRIYLRLAIPYSHFSRRIMDSSDEDKPLSRRTKGTADALRVIKPLPSH